jgi:hypothetical protein
MIAATPPQAVERMKKAIEYGQTYQCAEILKSKEHCSAN